MVANRTTAIGLHASAIYNASFMVLRWDGHDLIEQQLAELGDEAPEQLRGRNNRAVELARHGLWRQAAELIAQAQELDPAEEIVAWNARVIRLHADDHASEVATRGSGKVVNLAWYGDYDGAVELLRRYDVEALFDGSLLGDMELLGELTRPAEEALVQAATRALAVEPELAGAFFVRGWALAMLDVDAPAERGAQILADLQRAAKLSPSEPLFQESLRYFQGR